MRERKGWGGRPFFRVWRNWARYLGPGGEGVAGLGAGGQGGGGAGRIRAGSCARCRGRPW
eukprot:8028358-Prorocentrum_lima.AAC.1